MEIKWENHSQKSSKKHPDNNSFHLFMLEGLDILAGLNVENVFTLGIVEIRDSERPSSHSCATTQSFLLCSVWILKPRSLILCVCVCVTATVNGFPLTNASCLWNEERQPEKNLDVRCEKPPVRFQLNVCACLLISWALSRKLIYPEGEGIKHIQVEVSQSAVLQILPAEWKHSEVSGSTSLNARRASALTAAFSERRGSTAESTTNFLLFFLCLNKAFRRSSHQLIILFGFRS